VPDRFELMDTMSDDSDDPMSGVEEVNVDARELRESCKIARQSPRGDSTSDATVSRVGLDSQPGNFNHEGRNRLNGCISGEIRLAIAGLPGGPLGSSIEVARHEYSEFQICDGKDVSTSLTGKGEERHWEGDPQFPGKFVSGNWFYMTNT
jgi:hypothetical protein